MTARWLECKLPPARAIATLTSVFFISSHMLFPMNDSSFIRSRLDSDLPRLWPDSHRCRVINDIRAFNEGKKTPMATKSRPDNMADTDQTDLCLSGGATLSLMTMNIVSFA